MTSWILNYHTMEAALRGIFKLINLEVDRKRGPILEYPHCNVGHQFEAPPGEHLRDLFLLCISIYSCLPEVWFFKYVKCGRKVRLPTLLRSIIKSEGVGSRQLMNGVEKVNWVNEQEWKLEALILKDWGKHGFPKKHEQKEDWENFIRLHEEYTRKVSFSGELTLFRSRWDPAFSFLHIY